MGRRPTKWDESPPKYCGAGCQPAADWESACRHTERIFNSLRWAFDRAAGFFHQRARQFLPQETFRNGSPPVRVNAKSFTAPYDSGNQSQIG
jgi:hypothetical protein